MRRFFYANPICDTDDVREFLGLPKKNWKNSPIYELASKWLYASKDNVPPAIQRAFCKKLPELKCHRLIEAYFQKDVDYSDRPSLPVDLLAHVQLKSGARAMIAVIANTGKVCWRKQPTLHSSEYQRRLYKILNVDLNDTDGIPDKFIVSTMAAISEAKRYGCKYAIVLVHSLKGYSYPFKNFKHFSHVVGAVVKRPGSVSVPITLKRVGYNLVGAIENQHPSLVLAWVEDTKYVRKLDTK